jgi:hypothetical protein
MRTLSFTQYLENYRDITINIKDEELFRQKCEEWSKEEGFLSFWNFEDEFFEGCVEVSYGDIKTNNEENGEFYDLMDKENINTFGEE